MVLSSLCKMPSPDGEINHSEISTLGQVGVDYDLPRGFHESAPGSPQENVTTKTLRINPKRKPDKSKICHITSSETYIACSFCKMEFKTTEQAIEHEESCSKEYIEESSKIRDYPSDLRRHQDETNNNEADRRKSTSSPHSLNLNLHRNIECDSDSGEGEEGRILGNGNFLESPCGGTLSIAQRLARSNIALEAIQNTRLALVQLASNALGNEGTTNPQALQEMAVLQSTLYTLQHQQMLQMQLIQQLHSQLSIENNESQLSTTEQNNASPSREQFDITTGLSTHFMNAGVNKSTQNSISNSFISKLIERYMHKENDTLKDADVFDTTLTNSSSADPRDHPISPVLSQSNISSSVIKPTDPTPSEAPSTLEMLQRTTNEVLSNASQGLLTNRLIDDYTKPPEGNDSYYKHRCRYCGKVFGSDSALQIHVRSHTGERPFKCNVCGNRFTTKGNLKVHFQRHSARFPHVQMNPHLVPEHLDKLHPPLLAQLGELKDYPSPPTGPPDTFSTSPAFQPFLPFRLNPPQQHNFDLVASSRANDIINRDPNTHKEKRPLYLGTKNVNESHESSSKKEAETNSKEFINNSICIVKDNKNKSKYALELENDKEKITERDSIHKIMFLKTLETLDGRGLPKIPEIDHVFASSNEFQMTKSLDAENRNNVVQFLKTNVEERTQENVEIVSRTHLKENIEAISDIEDQDGLTEESYKENSCGKDTQVEIRVRLDDELRNSVDNDKLSYDSDNNNAHLVTSDQPTDLRIKPEFRQLAFPNMSPSGPRPHFPFLPPFRPPFMPPFPLYNEAMGKKFDFSKDPNIYSNLLPRPGSTDNSWEALIEVERGSETTKLEQMVNNIEHKLTDPNQCFICHRVLSCKSALQMHYRTHTGERPFKCKICGRSFTTKGNLKTHMAVHRAKPPMRMLHQCPVCHKKFTNAFVLQQHIRLHTGEPTDLTPEHISAAEVQDFPSSLAIPISFPPTLPGRLPIPTPGLPEFPFVPLHLRYQLPPEILKRYDMNSEIYKDEEERYSQILNNSSRSSSTNSMDQRMAEDLSLGIRDENMNGSLSPHHSISPTPSDYSDAEGRTSEIMNNIKKSEIMKFKNTSTQSKWTNPNLPNLKVPSVMPLDLTPKSSSSFVSPFTKFLSLYNPQIPSGTNPLSSINPLHMSNFSGRHGTTTCQVCFKIFACQSALEIHYRSHTKERPFKCKICDRRFSTKQGNMRQHLQTYQLQDGNVEESHTCGKKTEASAASLSPSSLDENVNFSHTKDDFGIKREREGELLLPESKRSTAIGEETDEQDSATKGSVISPDIDISQRSPSPHREVRSPVSQNSSHSSYSVGSVPIAASFTIPASISLPTSSSFSGTPFSFGSSTIRLSSTLPIPHS